jgi:PKD repeat protein
VIFAFSGCDAILEAFYPDETAGGSQGGGENGISVWVEIEIPAEGLGELEPIIGAVLVEPLEPGVQSEPTPVGGTYDNAEFVIPDWTYDDVATTWILTASVDFYGLVDDDYQVLVWLETTGDYKPAPVFEGTEPRATAIWVWWDEDDMPQDKGDVFMFPNEFQAKWLEGYAFIPLIGAGGQLDPVFYIDGEFTMDTDGLGQRTYTAAPRDGARQIAEIDANIYTKDWSTWITGFYDWDVHAGSTVFSFNYNNIPELGGPITAGDYWIDVWVMYGDGTNFWRTYPLRVIDEAASGAAVNMDVFISDLADWPFYLQADKSYPVRVQIIRNGSILGNQTSSADVFLGSASTYFEVLDTNFSVLQLSYAPSSYNNTGNTNDWVRVMIDVDANGTIDGADLVLNWPIGIAATEVGTGYTMYASSWDMVFARP